MQVGGIHTHRVVADSHRVAASPEEQPLQLTVAEQSLRAEVPDGKTSSYNVRAGFEPEFLTFNYSIHVFFIADILACNNGKHTDATGETNGGVCLHLCASPSAGATNDMIMMLMLLVTQVPFMPWYRSVFFKKLFISLNCASVPVCGEKIQIFHHLFFGMAAWTTNMMTTVPIMQQVCVCLPYRTLRATRCVKSPTVREEKMLPDKFLLNKRKKNPFIYVLLHDLIHIKHLIQPTDRAH